jgi:hypothetical protein
MAYLYLLHNFCYFISIVYYIFSVCLSTSLDCYCPQLCVCGHLCVYMLTHMLYFTFKCCMRYDWVV